MTRHPRNAFCLATAMLSLLGAAPLTAQEFDTLLKSVPEGANAVLLIDVADLKSTPLAEQQGWFEAHGKSDRPWYLPPEADHIVVATALDPTARLTAEWEAALISLTSPVDVKAVAQSEGGYVDTLGGKQAVWAPSDVYLIPLGPKLLGEMAPANRQTAARWAASTGKATTTVSPYLAATAKLIDDKSPIIMAFDLADAIPPHAVHEAVRNSDEIKADAKKRDEIAKVLASLQGVTVMVLIDDHAAATLRFDFAENVAPLVGIEDTLFSLLTARLGASVRANEGWKVKAANKAVRANGELSVSGLRRLLSLIEVPTTKFSSLADAKPAPTEQEIVLKASKEYFGAVTTMFEDLRETLSDADGNHALYMERYSRKIDRLPILNVDDDLLNWGATIAETLRGGGQSVRSAGLRSGVRKAGLYGAYQYSYDGYGYYGGQPTETARAEVSRQEGAAARADVYGSWKEMEDHTAEIRRAMTKKYGVEF